MVKSIPSFALCLKGKAARDSTEDGTWTVSGDILTIKSHAP